MTIQVSFTGYKHILKTYFDRGLLPSVKHGLYGDLLTPKNRTLEHLIPHSKGGPTVLWNLALASAQKNNDRGCRPLKEVLSQEKLEQYALQFEKVDLKKLWGVRYILDLLQMGKEQGIITKPSKLEKFKLDVLV